MTMSPHLPLDTGRLDAAIVRWFWALTTAGRFATDRDLHVVVWNRWMEIHSGRSASEAIGRSLLELYPELEGGLDECYREALAGRISTISYGLHKYLLRFQPTHPDLRLDAMPQSARIGPLTEGNEVVGTVTTLDNISDRLASEAELRRQIESERMARATAENALRVKDEFLATVSHELRNPLNAILGWARILIQRKDMDPELLRRALGSIERNAATQTRMIDDLLDVARLTSGKLRLDEQAVDLLAVALAAIDVMTPSAQAKQIVLRTKLDPKTPRVLGDPQRLQQVISNLLSNAVKFTDAGGVIELIVGRTDGKVRLVVKDTGQGISADFLPLVFERFRQGDASSSRRHGGLGIGLALVRELVDLHGGSVKAESAGEGQGASFTVDLPATVSPDVRQNGIDIASTADAPSLEGIRVLVVEDESDSRELLAEDLSRLGAEVSSAASSDEALEQLRQAAADGRPDVIISDLGMPRKDGFDLVRELRTLTPENGGQIPAIAVSGYARSDDQKRALAAGYQSHLAKPIDPVAIATAVWNAARRDQPS